MNDFIQIISFILGIFIIGNSLLILKFRYVNELVLKYKTINREIQ